MIRNCSDHGRVVACKDTIESIGHLRRHVVIQSLAKKKSLILTYKYIMITMYILQID